MPTLKTASQKTESIQIGMNTGSSLFGADVDETAASGGKWEDEEERRFYEEIPDLKDYVPRSVLGLEGESDVDTANGEEKERLEKEMVEEEFRKLEEELAEMKIDENGQIVGNDRSKQVDGKDEEDADESVLVSPHTSTRSADSLCLVHLLRPLGHPKTHRLRHLSWRPRVPRSSSQRFWHGCPTRQIAL